MQSLKDEIEQQISEMDENRAVKVQGKLEDATRKNKFSENINEENIDEEIRKLEKTNKRISTYQRFVYAFEKDLEERYQYQFISAWLYNHNALLDERGLYSKLQDAGDQGW